MLYPTNIESKLGFDKIKELISEQCISSLGKAYVEKIRWSSDEAMVSKMLDQTEEFRKLLVSDSNFPSTYFLDLTPQLDKAAIVGSYLIEEEFQRLKLSLQTVVQCVRFFAERHESYPELKKLSDHIAINKAVPEAISQKIDDNGVLKNNASETLYNIRKQLQLEQTRLRKVLDQVLKHAKSQGFTAEDTSFTVRDGRMVIPVSAEHKRRIKGFVHDESSSGQTVYLEPAEALDINNTLRTLQSQEKREIVRILTTLTDFVRPYIPELRKAYVFLGLVDFIRAKAKFALRIEAVKPTVYKKPFLDIINARHPLLLIAHKTQGKEVVPLTLRLDEHQRILLISGPNAGGKSVTLKTIGLLQYMLQSGLLVPVAEQSRFGLFKGIFIDIGDEQSIENDLSTYSSHLTNMKNFLLHADRNALCLIDEFGTGTEPAFGGAIAQAILEELNKKRVFGVITTHYANLKKFAEKSEGIVNGAMRFDLDRLEPLYQLEVGKPGSSFALEIAQKIGLPHKVIEEAKANIGVEQVQMDQLLGELEIERNKLAEKTRELTEKHEALQKELESYKALSTHLETHKRQLMREARAEAKRLVAEANQKIENAVREIKESQADKQKTKASRATIENLKKGLQRADKEDWEEGMQEEVPVEYVPESGEIQEGDYVQLKGQGAVGEVLSVQGKSALVAMGSLKSVIKISRLQRLSRKEKRKLQEQHTYRPPMQGINLVEKRSNFSTNLDLRGMRGEEALAVLETYIDEASMFGVHEVRVIHGKGDGILRRLTRDKLKQTSQVRTFQDEHIERGGDGVTLVYLD